MYVQPTAYDNQRLAPATVYQLKEQYIFDSYLYYGVSSIKTHLLGKFKTPVASRELTVRPTTSPLTPCTTSTKSGRTPPQRRYTIYGAWNVGRF